MKKAFTFAISFIVLSLGCQLFKKAEVKNVSLGDPVKTPQDSLVAVIVATGEGPIQIDWYCSAFGEEKLLDTQPIDINGDSTYTSTIHKSQSDSEKLAGHFWVIVSINDKPALYSDTIWCGGSSNGIMNLEIKWSVYSPEQSLRKTNARSFNAFLTPVKPQAEFSATPTSGSAPLHVMFTDLSSGVPSSWFWDFGDTETSTAHHPTHIYSTEGQYTVTLIVSNADGADTLIKPNYISVTNRDIALWAWYEGIEEDEPECQWQYPDATLIKTSGDTGVIVRYPESGTYSVSVIVKSLAGVDSASTQVTVP